MATLDYERRLQNLQNRRYDYDLNESTISKSFSNTGIPGDVKYLVESMMPIPTKSTEKTVEAARRVQNHLEPAYNLPFKRTYRRQGSIMSNTHIKVSDFDLLNIIDGYYYLEPGLPNDSPYTGDPFNDITKLREQSLKTLRGIYDNVDDSNEKCISIINKSLNQKVDVVFAFWYNTLQFNNSQNEYYRGVKFKTNQTQADYPFAHIKIVNDKGINTADGSRKGIRLLKNLKEDSEQKLEQLKSFHLTTIVHLIDNAHLYYSRGKEINIAKALSSQLQVLIEKPAYRKSVKSPNGIETPLENDKLLPELTQIKDDLDLLIEDSTKDLQKSESLQNSVFNY